MKSDAHNRHENEPDKVTTLIFELLSKVACKLDTIMSAISIFAEKQNAYNVRVGAAIDSIVASQTGIVADIQSLNDKITELQNSPGGVTPADQALIDELQTQGNALSDRAETLAQALKALDDAIPPVVPPVA